MDQAGSRQDFHMLNRVRRFLDGPDTIPGWPQAVAHSMPRADVFDADDMEELARAMAVAGMAGMPDKEVRKLVSEFGRNRAIDMLADIVADTPLGGGSVGPAARAAVRGARRARDRRPRTAGAAMTGLAARGDQRTMTTDPFAVLGVDENAGDEAIKQRYLALVRAYPPDREPDRFQAVSPRLRGGPRRTRAAGSEAAATRHRGAVPAQAALPAYGRHGAAPAVGSDDDGAAPGRAVSGRPLNPEFGKEPEWTLPSRKPCWTSSAAIWTASRRRPRNRTRQGAEADLFTVFVELAAVRNEVRTESRLVKEALDQFRGVFATLQSSHATLEQELKRVQAEARERGRALLRPLLLELLDLRDRLAAGLQPPTAPPRALARSLAQPAASRAGKLAGRPRHHAAAARPHPGRPPRGADRDGRAGGSIPASARVVGTTQDASIGAGIVVEEVSAGFLWDDELLRAAEVIVSKAGAEQEETV